jgi:hypothetical protein
MTGAMNSWVGERTEALRRYDRACPPGLKCIECLRHGHDGVQAFEYVDGVPLCIFCRDGDPCPGCRKVIKDNIMPTRDTDCPGLPGHAHCGKPKNVQRKYCPECQKQRWAGKPVVTLPAPIELPPVVLEPIKQPIPEAPATVASETELVRPSAAPKNGHAPRKAPQPRFILEVSEPQLNKFLLNLPVEEKRRLAQSYLDQPAE